MANVIVCSKLVHGLSLIIDRRRVTLNGQNSNTVVVSQGGYTGECGYTEMSEEIWNKIKEKYATLVPLQKGLIFAVKNEASARSAAQDAKDVTTGTEQKVLDPNSVFKF